MRLTLSMFLFISIANSALLQAAERVALVIGNDAYTQFQPLAQAGGDASRVADALTSLAQPFEVQRATDLDERGLRSALRRFGDRLGKSEGEVALIYYAGHAVSHDNQLWLLPVDSLVDDPGDVAAEGVPLDDVVRVLQGKGWKAAVLILDACRNELFARGRAPRGMRGDALPRGLPAVPRVDGLIVAYATAMGEVAKEDPDQGGWYTRELVQRLVQPGVKLQDVFNDTALAVQRRTGQRPELSLTAMETIYLAGPGQPAGGASSAAVDATLRLDASLGNRQVMLHGHGLVPRQGLTLPKGKHVVQVELRDEADRWAACHMGELQVAGDRVLDAAWANDLPVAETCELAFESARVTTLRIAGRDRRFSWFAVLDHRYGFGPTEVLFIDGVRHQPPLDGEAFELSGYYESGGNRFGGANRTVAACMDGNRPMVIARGYDRPSDEELYYVEFLEVLAPVAGKVGTRMIAQIDEAMDDADFEALYQCKPDCRCAVGDWLAAHEQKRQTGLEKSLATLVHAPLGSYRVQSRASVEAALESLTQTPGVRVARDQAVIKIDGVAPQSLWLGYSAQADAWQSIWSDEASRLQLTSSEWPTHGFALPHHRSRFALLGEDADAAKAFAMECVAERCWLFDAEKLQISSVFPETAVSEIGFAVGTETLRVDHRLSWRPTLAPMLEQAHLGPVIDDIRRLGGLPRIDHLVDGDPICLGTDEWRRYSQTLQTATQAFNQAAHTGKPVRWRIDVARENDASCGAKLAFPDEPDLVTAWAVWSDPEARARQHVWQAVYAIATLASPAITAGNATGEVSWEQSGDESRRIEGIRKALDRDPDEATELRNPACVDSGDAAVWRIDTAHSVVVDRPPNWRASATRPLLSVATILRGVRSIDEDYLTYFKAEGEGWRFAVFDMATKQETAGALLEKLPRYCVLDPMKREVLQIEDGCVDCSDYARRATW